MNPLNRAVLVVKPSLPCINWIRKVLGMRLTVEDVRREGGAYLVSLEAIDYPLEVTLERYGEVIFELELASWTTDLDLWPSKRDLKTFRQWFDVELREQAVDLEFGPVYFEPDDELISQVFEEFENAPAWTDDVDIVIDRPPASKLFPSPRFESTGDTYQFPDPPATGPIKGRIHQFKIVLASTEPEVWRRIQVPSKYSFWDLHVAITDAMGWLDYHLHIFSVRNPETGELDPFGIFDESDPDCLPDELYPMAGYFREKGDRGWYTYDYGDMWVHEIVLEEVLPREKGKRYPICIDGAGACPPEDIGGVIGYRRMLKILDDPTHRDHESIVKWTGGVYDPTGFDTKNVHFDSPKKRWEKAFGPE